MVNRSDRGGPASLPAAYPAMINAKRKFCKHFKGIADREDLISCYMCSMPQDGRSGTLYLSASWICFYSKMLSKRVKVVISMPKVTSITQEKTAKIIPNAIRITTENESYVFASFVARNHVYKKLLKLWKNSETASDSGTSDLDAQQQSTEDAVLEAVNFTLSDSESASSECSVPALQPSKVGSDSVDLGEATNRLSMLEATSGENLAAGTEASACAVPGVVATSSSSAGAAVDDKAAASARPSSSSPMKPPAGAAAEAADAAVGSHSDQHVGCSLVPRIEHMRLQQAIRRAAARVASVSCQSTMLLITVVLCFTSFMTMYRLAVLESTAASIAGDRSLLSSGRLPQDADDGLLLLLAGGSSSGKRSTKSSSDRLINAILDMNLQQLQEIKDSLDILKTLIEKRQQETLVAHAAASKIAIQESRELQPTAPQHTDELFLNTS